LGTTEEALARFMRRLAQAATDTARELEAVAGTGVERPEEYLDRLDLGTKQRKIVNLPGVRDDRGMKVSEIAKAIGRTDLPNTYTALDSLERRGVLERVPTETPRRYRLSDSYRATEVG
jgi:DNA-binding MarR family transcriptional regulator